MRGALVLMLVACGGVQTGPTEDAGRDAGNPEGELRQWACVGYTYCRGADGGLDPRHFNWSTCVRNRAEAEAAFVDAGRPTHPGGESCARNYACDTDGGGC